jgi:probable rRNA maturation factor
MGTKIKFYFGDLKIEVRAVEGLILPLRTRPILRTTAGRVLQFEKQANKELDVLLTTDLQIQKLNQKYLSKNRPTDVMAFSQEDEKALGDIVISVETAMRQAQDEGHDLLTELQYLLVHGILHLLGHDDRSPSKRKVMRQKEKQILAKLNIEAHPEKD